MRTPSKIKTALSAAALSAGLLFMSWGARPLLSVEFKVAPCFYASWDESLSADKSSGASSPVKDGLAEITAKAARRGKGGLDVQTDDAHVDYATKDMWPKEEGTVAFWYRPRFEASAGVSRHSLLYTTTKNNHTANQFNIRFDSSHPPYNELQVVYQANGEVKMAIKKPDWKANEWHHLCVTWDKEELLLYLDGAEAARADMPAARHEIATPLIVGSVFGNNANADFDALTVWPKALTDLQIKDLLKTP